MATGRNNTLQQRKQEHCSLNTQECGILLPAIGSTVKAGWCRRNDTLNSNWTGMGFWRGKTWTLLERDRITISNVSLAAHQTLVHCTSNHPPIHSFIYPCKPSVLTFDSVALEETWCSVETHWCPKPNTHRYAPQRSPHSDNEFWSYRGSCDNHRVGTPLSL